MFCLGVIKQFSLETLDFLFVVSHDNEWILAQPAEERNYTRISRRCAKASRALFDISNNNNNNNNVF